MSTSHDTLFKRLLTNFFVEFIELFFPEILEYLDTNSITFIQQEYYTNVRDTINKRLDIIAQARFQEQDYSFLIHIEPQASSMVEFNRRMFRYFCDLFLKYNRPVLPIALFTYNSPQRAETDNFIIEVPYFIINQFNFKVVQLNRLRWQNYTDKQNALAAALMAKMKIQPQERPQVKLECLKLLGSLELNPAKNIIIGDFIDRYLPLNSQEQQNFDSLLDRLNQKEKTQVLDLSNQWTRKGRQEGRQEGELKIVLRILNRKLGTLSTQLTEKVSYLKPSQLEALAEDLLDFQTFSDLEFWLDSH